MNKDQVKGTAKASVGKVQRRAGKLVGSRKQQAKRVGRQIEGGAHIHGGTVEARSEGIGKGAEFIVQLPIALAQGEQPDPLPAPTEQHDTNTIRVLVVDDNVDGCLTLAYILRLEAYSVQMAHTGPEALAVAQTWRPDVVLLDIGLPQLDGYEVARRLRADPALKNLKLVAMTGYGNEKDLRRTREVGFDAHLVKPVDLAVVQKLLKTWNRPPRG